MRKAIGILATAVLVLTLVFILAQCGGYRSSYRAVGYVHSNGPCSASMSFYQFTGTNVMKLKCGKDAAGELAYSAKLESGNATVFLDRGEGKTELLTISGGEELASTLTGLEKGAVYIIFETDGQCENGSFYFEIR